MWVKWRKNVRQLIEKQREKNHCNRDQKAEIETEIETKGSEDSKIKKPKILWRRGLWKSEACSRDWWLLRLWDCLTETEMMSPGCHRGTEDLPRPWLCLLALAYPMELGRPSIPCRDPNCPSILQLAPSLWDLRDKKKKSLFSPVCSLPPLPSGFRQAFKEEWGPEDQASIVATGEGCILHVSQPGSKAPFNILIRGVK